MIQINKIIEVDGGVAPYTYQWSTDDACITFSIATGTTNTGTIETIVNATSETCITTAVVTLDVTDSTGCASSAVISIDNKCSSLSVTPITQTSLNTFTVSAATVDCSTVSFEWIYDSAIFEKVSQSDGDMNSTLVLDFKDGVAFPTQSPIKAKVTDCYQCKETAVYNNPICIPDPYELTVYMHYDAVAGKFISGQIEFPLPTNCPTYTYTTNAPPNIATPSGMSASFVNTGSGFTDVIFSGNADKEGEIIEGTYTVVTSGGITSTRANITYIFGTIEDAKTIYVSDKTWNIDCGDVAGDTITLNIEDQIVVATDATIDWSTWQVVMEPSAAATPTLSTDANGDHIISFVLPTPLVNDSFAWVLCDTDGACSRTVTYTVAECNTPPVAVDDTVVTECGLTEEIDVLSNDTASDSVIDITSLEVVTHPTYGTVTVISGQFSYTANCNTTGSDSFTYRFKDSSGVYSNTATVDLTISCAGVGSNVTLCN